MRTFTSTVLVVTMLLVQARSSGVFEVRVTSLSNDKGMTSRGECCNSVEDQSSCRKPCQTFLTICLMHYQNKIVRAYPSCTFGQFATPLLGGNNIDLREETGDGPYTVKLPFTFSWPTSFTLIVQVWHDVYGNRSVADEKQILEVTKTGSIFPSPAWTSGQQGNRHAELTFAYRVVCDVNYYGDGCDRLCKARDDQFGHYICSDNGTKLCLDGWTGRFCDQAVCHERCDQSHGFCDSPILCRCRLGWQGQYCEECVISPDCQNGFCYEPWQCICNQGWTGINCDIDVRFCEKYEPCMNGGSCRSDWASNFTCECPRGYGGRACQSAICEAESCHNGGLCVEMESSTECVCQEGFFGERCEQVHLTCNDLVCQNNGTCQLDESGRRCLCPSGFTGAVCEIDVHECMSSPCHNGGECVDEQAGYWCDCPPGFSGILCEIQLDSCEHIRCENGGNCSSELGTARCECPVGFEGVSCERPAQPCPPEYCANGGLCLQTGGTRHCSCRRGFRGRTCKTATNVCGSLTCKNSSLCKTTAAGIGCNCSGDLQVGGGCQELQMSRERVIGGVSLPAAVPVISGAGGTADWARTLSIITGCVVMCLTV